MTGNWSECVAFMRKGHALVIWGHDDGRYANYLFIIMWITK